MNDIPKKIVVLRKDPMIKKWRASGHNYTLIENPTIKEFLERPVYLKRCEQYVTAMIFHIIKRERNLYDSGLQLKSAEYYVRNYDVTDVENKILMNRIFNEI